LPSHKADGNDAFSLGVQYEGGQAVSQQSLEWSKDWK